MTQAPEAAVTDLRYPIGKFTYDGTMTDARRSACVARIAAAPAALRAAVAGLTDAQLDTPYRPDGWTVRQVVHHVPDSHLNAYVRMRLALTEDTPTIKPYEEARWAELPDARTLPVEVSLALLEALQKGTICGAGLDVFADEPRVPEAFFALENVVLQPHVASATHPTRRAMGQLVLDNLAAHYAGKPLVTPI